MPEVMKRQLLPLVKDILSRRGYDEAAALAFIDPDYDSGLHDPWLLTDMTPAVDRIERAIKGSESIAIYGDYDIDGLTATSLMLDCLGGIGAKVQAYIPDRFEEGYGINQAALKKLQKAGVDLVISVDCGVTSVKEAAWAKQHGMDLIITDHHAVPEQIPDAIAVINPKRSDDKYPFKDLAGVGVAFKLAQALQQRLGRPALGQEKWLLDLVALGTVCDVVTLVDENRVLVKYGLKVMAKSRRSGIWALAEVAKVQLPQVSSYHLGFMFGPRLNAAGRLEHATKALNLLTGSDRIQNQQLAANLDQLNLERRQRQAEILDQANAQAAGYESDPVLVLADEQWSHGIVGIVASKLMERWHKPTLVLQILGATSKGSGRSTAQFNLVEGLRSLDQSRFVRLGGHFFAAGFTIHTQDIDWLRQSLNQLLADQAPAGQPEVALDLELGDFGQLDLGLIDELELLEPHGNGNPKPIFGLGSVKILKLSQVGETGKHLKLTLADQSGNLLSAIGFNLAEQHPNLSVGQEIGIKFQVIRNDFFDQPKVELSLVSIN